MTKKQTQRKKQSVLHSHVKRVFVPHKSNQYRPHLIRLHGVTAVLVLALMIQVVYGFVTDGRLAVLGHISSVDTTVLVTETNEARATEELAPLTVNPTLNQAAELKANDMLANDYWAHTSPSGVTPWHWLETVDYAYAQAGENLAKNYPNASATVDAWMSSPTHRANIMNENFTEVGFAVVQGELDDRETDLVVAYYGAPKGSALVSEALTEGQSVNAPNSAPSVSGVWNYFVTAWQSLTPATMIALALLTLVSVVSLAAHHFRKKLPAAWRKSWKVHHGMFIFIGAVGLAMVMIFATGGGQI